MKEPAQWATVSRLVVDHDLPELVRVLKSLGDDDRKQLVAPLRAFERDPPREGRLGPWNGLAIAGAGILPSPAALVPWLARSLFTYTTHDPDDPTRLDTWHDVVDEIVEVLLARRVSWIPGLIDRLATRLPSTPSDWELSLGGASLHTVVERLRVAVDGEPPVTDGYLVGILIAPFGVRWYVEQAAADPRFAALAPRFPEFDGVGLKLRQYRDRDTGAPTELAAAADAGVLDRAALLDAVIGRLQRGGRGGATQGFLQLYQALAPTLDELDSRRRDLLVLVADAPGVVATVAHGQLLALDAAGRLNADELVDTARSALVRTEKGVVRSQLAHLADVGKRPGAPVGEVATIVATSAGVATVDVQRAAVALLVGWAPALATPERAAVLEAAGGLPADLATRLTAALGAPASATTRARIPQTRLERPEPTRLVPFRAMGDLVPDLMLLGRQWYSLTVDAASLERVLEALVRFGRDDPAGLHTMLRGHLSKNWGHVNAARDAHLSSPVHAVARAAFGAPALVVETPGAYELPMQTAVLNRLARTAREIEQRPGGLLVSTPSDTRGVIDPADLLDRLGRAAREVWEPWPSDLDQALLRLDLAAAASDPGGEAFAALGTAAGRATAARIAGPAPEATTTLAAHRPVTREWASPWVAYAVRDEEPADAKLYLHRPRPHLVASVRAGDGGRFGAIWTAATRIPPPGWHSPSGNFGHSVVEPATWAMALPWHADLVAAHLLPIAAEAAHFPWVRDGMTTPAENPGPVGDALAALVGYCMSAGQLEVRAAATDALLAIAARPDHDGARLGRILGDMLVGKLIAASRVVEPLQSATVAGAATTTWPALREMTAAVAAVTWTVPGAADVLVAAAAAATAARARGSFDALDAFAARKGSSRQLVEARRLRDLLVG